MRNLSVRWGSNQFPNRSAVPPPVGRPRGCGGPHREFTMRFCRRLLSFAERFKNARALEMRLFRHGGIYRSDVSSHLINLGRGAASRSGPSQAIGRAGRNTPCPSSAMSSGRLFLDRVARQHCPSPLHRHCQIKTVAAWKGTDYHRTVPGVLTLCLTRGAHPSSTNVNVGTPLVLNTSSSKGALMSLPSVSLIPALSGA